MMPSLNDLCSCTVKKKITLKELPGIIYTVHTVHQFSLVVILNM